MYRLSDDNRRFLHARLLPQPSDASLDAAAAVIRKMLSFTSVLHGRFQHNQVKRLIDQFEKAAGEDAGVGRLLLVDLASALATFHKTGGSDEAMVNHIYATMTRLDKLLEKLDTSAAAPLVAELSELARRWSGEFGWGVSDELDGLAAEWRAKLRDGGAEDG
jgi:hypothetical protein